MNKKFLLKKLKKWKRSLLTYLEKRNCQRLSEVSRFCTKSLKNAYDGVAMALEFFTSGNYFCGNSFMALFEFFFIWLNLLGPGVHSSYPQYNLIYPQYHSSICVSLCRISQLFGDVLRNNVLKILQYSQENTCAGVSLITFRPEGVFQHRRFSVNIAKLLRTAFFIKHLWCLFLTMF